jgi:uncharacterized protein YycO
MPPSAPAPGPGNYICLKTGGWLAWLIRRSTHSKVNHAVIVTADGGIIEATPQGVQRGTLAEYAGSYAVANTAEAMTGSQRVAVVTKAQSLIGDAYNYADLLAIGLGDLGWHWRLLLRIARADKLLICSQLVAVCGAAAVPPMPWQCGKADPSQVTPADLANRTGTEPVSI